MSRTTTCDSCLIAKHFRCRGCACSCTGPKPKVRPARDYTPRSTSPRRVPRSIPVTAVGRPTPFQTINSRAFATEVERLTHVIHG